MDSFPAEWRTIGGPAAAVRTAPGPQPAGGSSGGRGIPGIAPGHRLIALIAAVAAGTGALALAGTLWLTTPQSATAIIAHAGAAGGHDLLGDGSAGARSQLRPGPADSAAALPIATEHPAELIVDVEGAVRRPGIEHLSAGSRVGDAIAAAGGYGNHADVAAAARTLNLAESLQDGAKVRVPALGDSSGLGPAAPAPAGTATARAGAPIDLNHSDLAQLESLPGVGPVTAGKIIDARTAAPFATLDDLATRGVVGAGTLQKLRALATVTP